MSPGNTGKKQEKEGETKEGEKEGEKEDCGRGEKERLRRAVRLWSERERRKVFQKGGRKGEGRKQTKKGGIGERLR